MTTLVAVRKHDEIAIAADSLTTFGDLKLAAAFDKSPEKIVHYRGTYLGLCGSAAHQLVFESLLASREDLDFSGRLAIFSDAALAHARSLLPAVSLALRVASRPVDPLPTLSDTERELLSHLALGFSTAEIARARSRSFFTVRNQLAALYRKLEVANRAEALGRLCRA